MSDKEGTFRVARSSRVAPMRVATRRRTVSIEIACATEKPALLIISVYRSSSIHEPIRRSSLFVFPYLSFPPVLASGIL
jgi:hypothetical protein